MDTIQNQLSAIKQKYAGCNLLMPSTSEVQMNPFYKISVMEVKADLSPNSGDVFRVGSIKTGYDSKTNKDIWEDTFSPAKPLLMKLSAAAGIQFDPNNTYGTLVSKNCYKAKAYGAMRMPDGTGKTHCDEKVINLEDEEDRFRLEFMDKSIEGIKDKRAAEEAAKMFTGEWINTKDKWNKPCQAYRIADQDRQKYIDRSVLVNMTQLRKTAAEKAMTGAILRVIRALIGMKGQYTKQELQKPFAVARVTFSPDYNDPEVRHAMLEQSMNAVGNMFGLSGTLPSSMSTPTETSYSTVNPIFNPEDFSDNPAFTSDVSDTGDSTAPVPNDYPEESTSEGAADPQTGPSDHSAEPLVCIQCEQEISQAVYDFSIRKYGAPLCMKCQKECGQ